ncbi:hypothetical protein KTAU_40400 [Thermogemmatispora aurantia]|uniref:Uncharacterized protein n=1 Tax=Thermogemmatispora aurantia TaxID=2045279 RepID=A0A5J4KDD1_9CHLR|nr:hypothetical protein KTAU_40400 [Thermogemmatispora aurantia]
MRERWLAGRCGVGYVLNTCERRLIIAVVVVDNFVDKIGGKALPGEGAWRTRCTAQSPGVVTRYKGGS